MRLSRYMIAFLVVMFTPIAFAEGVDTMKLSPRESVQSSINQFVNSPSLMNASVGVCVTRLSDQEVLGEYCSLQSQITASTMKTVTSATALKLLGNDYRFHTNVIATGEINDKGHIEGNLVIKGGGDPTLGSGYMPEAMGFIERLLLSLKEKGITKIKGNILIDDTAYPSPYVPGSWMIEDLSYGYGTSVHALNFSDNTLRLNYTIDKNKFRYNTIQGQNYLKVVNHCRVVDDATDTTVMSSPELRLDIDTDVLHLYGKVKPHSRSITIANPSPDLLLCDSLETVLKSAGIEIKHKHIDTKDVDVTTQILDYESPALTDIVNSLLVRSDNMYTECVLRAIAVNAGKPATHDYGVEVVKQYWQGLGVDVSGLFMVDGSGLSRTNKAPASFFNHMLTLAHRDLLAAGVDFHKLFPVAGKNGTVRRLAAKTTASGKFALKSGSMSHVQCYVGYYPVENPEYTVSILVNSFTCPRGELVKMVSDMLVGIDNALTE